MLLAVDVGNTNTVMGLYAARDAERHDATGGVGTAVADWRLTTPVRKTADELGILLGTLFAARGLKLAEVTGVAISSVVPPLDSVLRQMCEATLHLKPLFVEPGVKTGLPVLTDNPSEVGADRIVNCVAAYDLVGGPAIVVDMGTATTFDVVSGKGEFLGGAIAPGLGISAEALFSRAARLTRVEVKKPAKIVGTSTIDNLQIGLYYGYIGLVDGVLERMLAELGPKTKTLATGGLAGLIVQDCKHVHRVEPMLTLHGLRLIWERNQDRLKKHSREPVSKHA